MRVLFLSQRVPYPPNRGDKITTWRLIERLARRHEVEVVAFETDEADRRGAADLRAKGFSVTTVPLAGGKLRLVGGLLGGRPLTLVHYGSPALQAVVDRLAPTCDLAYAYSSSMGAFFLPHALPRVMHFAELDSDKWRQYAEKKPWPLSWVYRREWRLLREFEQEVAHATVQNVFCTPLEEAIFNQAVPGPPSVVMRNGVDLETYAPAPEEAEPDHIVFVGVMDYFPNVDGCRWFVQDILPRIRAERPDVRFTIVGSHPTPEVQALAREPGVEVTGFVDDTRDYLRRAALSVAPLRIARGIQNKVLEAMAMGLPTVGTTSATQGVSGEDGRDYVVADDAEAQAREVLKLLHDPEAAKALGRRARAFVEAHYDWEVCLAPLDEILVGTGDTVPHTTSRSAN